ncbi:hypothetical protein FH972_012542 [Carpinus fangiana]|uniref:RNase H type-1 domain-containing protein n=1 Tax=Carpinus fangiana TaxID=176857 RepID=A0A5N6R426_9ROSI|nr:hypothetical protein FH972_012542 [Carpinus fangiana]
MYGWVKTNWDVALDGKTGRMGFGVIVRDHNGDVKVMGSRQSVGFLSPFAVEGQAVLMAIEFCVVMGFTKVYLEGDAKGVVEGVLSKEKNNGQYGHVLEDIQEGWVAYGVRTFLHVFLVLFHGSLLLHIESG